MKYAVLSELNSVESKGWFVNETKPVFMISFYSKLNTGLLEDCINTPRMMYMGVKNQRYDFNSKKAIKFGVVKSSGNLGSYSECFFLDKKENILNLLEVKGFEIVNN